MELTETRKNSAEQSEHKLLATIDHIVAEAGEHLDSSELEKLNCCWDAVVDLHKACWYAKQNH